MKIADVRAKTVDQLREELLNLRKDQLNFRFRKSTGQLEGTHTVRQARRDVARIKTVLNELKQDNVPAAAAKKAKAPKKASGAAKKKKES